MSPLDDTACLAADLFEIFHLQAKFYFMQASSLKTVRLSEKAKSKQKFRSSSLRRRDLER